MAIRIGSCRCMSAWTAAWLPAVLTVVVGATSAVAASVLSRSQLACTTPPAPMLNVACDMAFDDRTCVENVRQCYRLLNKLIEKCKSNLKKLGDEVLLDRSSNSSSPEGSQLYASRLKKLARAFETCGDFECQKEITIISIHLLHSKKCDSFDPTTEHGMKTIKTLFPKRSEEI